MWCNCELPSHWQVAQTIFLLIAAERQIQLINSFKCIRLFMRAPDCSSFQMSICYTPSVRVSLIFGTGSGSSGWLSGVWVPAQSLSSSDSVAHWSLSSWTACSPRHPLLWHPSRSSWPLGMVPPCSRGGRGFSHRRSKMDWGSGRSHGEGDFLDQRLQAAPVAFFSSENNRPVYYNS